jgi:transcriptional regulator with XRE-family HTH domain
MTVNTKWFQDRIRDADLSQRRLAKLLGLDSSALSLMFRGKRGMRIEEATQIAEILALPIDQVLAHAGVKVPRGPSSVAIVGVVDAADEVHARKGGGRADSHDGLPRDCVAVRCEDHASVMYMWTFYFSPASAVSSEAVGRFSVCRIANGPDLLAVPSRGYEVSTYNLRLVNGTKRDNQKLISASPVLWIRTD